MGLFDLLFKKKKTTISNSSFGENHSESFDKVSSSIDKPEAVPRPLNMMEQRIKYFYDHPETLVDIEFSNRTKQTINIWVELACVSIDLDSETEYKIVSHDRYFRMEFDENNHVVFYLQYSFGFKLYKRQMQNKGSTKVSDWTIDYDCSEIN